MGYGGFRRGGGFRRDFGPREMHTIKCSECGKEAEVPFKPIEGRPVYCKECFMKKKGITPRESEAPATAAPAPKASTKKKEAKAAVEEDAEEIVEEVAEEAAAEEAEEADETF